MSSATIGGKETFWSNVPESEANFIADSKRRETFAETKICEL